jgi:O-antigen ligase
MPLTELRANPGRRRRLKTVDGLILSGTLALIAWGTLAFGAPYPWAYIPLFTAAAVIGTTAFWRARAVRIPRETLWMLVALTATGFAAAAQAIPLPHQVRTAISPASESFLREVDVRYSAAVMLREHAGDDVDVPLRPLSLYAPATMRSVAMLAALTLFMAGLIKLFGRVGPDRLVPWIIALGALLAIIGIVQKALLGDHAAVGMKIYGFWEPRYTVTTPFGPYVNKNHYAGWMIMALPLALGYLLAMSTGWFRSIGSGWRDRLLWLSSSEGGRTQIIAFAIVLMALALTMTMSRSGLLALTLALLSSVLIGARRYYSMRARAGLSAALLALIAGGVLWADVDVAARFQSAHSLELRRMAWRDAVSIMRDFPLVGTGLNTYATATLKYDTRKADVQFHEAHNEYLQLAAEGGVWLGVPIIVAIVCCVRSIAGRLREDAQDPASYWLRFGASMGVLAMAIQSLVEFSLQMPGNAAFFVVLAAIALHPSRPQQDPRASLAAPIGF